MPRTPERTNWPLRIPGPDTPVGPGIAFIQFSKIDPGERLRQTAPEVCCRSEDLFPAQVCTAKLGPRRGFVVSAIVSVKNKFENVETAAAALRFSSPNRRLFA